MSLCGLRTILQLPHLGLLFSIHISKFKLTSVDSALWTSNIQVVFMHTRV